MIILSNTTEQTLAPGQSITFDNVVLKTGTSECHRDGTSSVKMCAEHAIYEVHFSGNVAGTAADVLSLAFQLSGDTLPETAMDSYGIGAGNYINISTVTAIRNCCCDYDRVTVTNVGTTTVTVAPNASLFVKRIA